MDWALTDVVMGGALLLSLVLGAWRGLVAEAVALGAWVVGFVVARWCAADVAQSLPWAPEAAPQVREAAAFVLVFVVAMLATGVLGWLLGKAVATAGLGAIDRGLGAVFGLARGLLVLLALTAAVWVLGLRAQAWWQMSVLAPLLEGLLVWVAPLLPAALQAYLPL